MNQLQYQIVATRRQGFDSILWQVPAFGLAAQGFLISSALEKDIDNNISAVAFLFSFFIGIGVILLFRALRMREVYDSELLRKHESEQPELTVIHGVRLNKISMYYVWIAILYLFSISALVGSIVRFDR